MNLKQIAILSLVLCWSGPSYSTPLQDISVIEHTAYVYALEQGQARYGNPQVVVGSLDSRLRLQQCSRELTAFNNSPKFDLGNQTIGVKCDSETPWTVYVPVTIKLFKPVVVSTRPLQANQIIHENDIAIREVDVSTMRYVYFQEPKKLIGQQLKYPMAKGVAVTSQSVRPQKLIKRGELITLMAETQGMQVKMSGTALSDGVLGQKIKVKNSSSERVVEGTVDGHGVVRVMM